MEERNYLEKYQRMKLHSGKGKSLSPFSIRHYMIPEGLRRYHWRRKPLAIGEDSNDYVELIFFLTISLFKLETF